MNDIHIAYISMVWLRVSVSRAYIVNCTIICSIVCVW